MKPFPETAQPLIQRLRRSLKPICETSQDDFISPCAVAFLHNRDAYTEENRISEDEMHLLLAWANRIWIDASILDLILQGLVSASDDGSGFSIGFTDDEAAQIANNLSP